MMLIQAQTVCHLLVTLSLFLRPVTLRPLVSFLEKYLMG